MGSFRWRNPAPCTAVHTLNWSTRTDEELEAVASSFVAHHALHHGTTRTTLFPDLGTVEVPLARFRAAWPEHPARALHAGQELLSVMRPLAREHYGYFGDEAAYLALRHDVPADARHWLSSLAAAMTHPEPGVRRAGFQLFEDSNLHKLCTHLNTLTTSGPVPAALAASAS